MFYTSANIWAQTWDCALKEASICSSVGHRGLENPSLCRYDQIQEEGAISKQDCFFCLLLMTQLTGQGLCVCPLLPQATHKTSAETWFFLSYNDDLNRSVVATGHFMTLAKWQFGHTAGLFCFVFFFSSSSSFFNRNPDAIFPAAKQQILWWYPSFWTHAVPSVPVTTLGASVTTSRD